MESMVRSGDDDTGGRVQVSNTGQDRRAPQVERILWKEIEESAFSLPIEVQNQFLE